MVSAVQRGLGDPRDLGRLGAACAPGRDDETSVLDSELVSLEHWLRKFAPRQLVWCGRAEPSVVALLEDLSRAELTADAPRLIVIEGGCGSGEGGVPRAPSVTREPQNGKGGLVRVSGGFDDLETLRLVRTLLQPSGAVALILTGDVTEAEVEPLLNGLAPFLGSNGVVLAASGRYHGDEMEAPTAMGRPLKAWLTKRAANLGFAHYRAQGGDRAGARDWIVLWHSPDAMDWSRQWMPIVADLECHANKPVGGGAPSLSEDEKRSSSSDAEPKDAAPPRAMAAESASSAESCETPP
jgi:hypothetical protein